MTRGRFVQLLFSFPVLHTMKFAVGKFYPQQTDEEKKQEETKKEEKKEGLFFM